MVSFQLRDVYYTQPPRIGKKFGEKMGIFSRNFDRPGPGVRKDEPRKKGFARFFELLTRDFGDLIKLNLLFCICIVPTVAALIIGSIWINIGIAFIIAVLFAFPVGGALVAYIYYITKMMRDDPSYVWYEFKRKFLENYKQAAPIGMLCTAFIYAQIWIWASLWGALLAEQPFTDHIWFLIAFLSIIIFFSIAPYLFMHVAYIKLKTRQIIKNSVLMAFGYFPRSLMGALTGCSLWIVFVLFLPASIMFLPVVLLIVVSLSLLMSLMWVWPPFNKHFTVEETLSKRQGEEEEESQQENV